MMARIWNGETTAADADLVRKELAVPRYEVVQG